MTSNVKVLKYGGSSLATPDHIRSVAKQILERKQAGENLVVVASAMGETTDELISLSSRITEEPRERELDRLLSTGESVSTALLSMALQSLGHDAVSLSGAQSGIHTSDEHFNARVEYVDAGRILEELAQDRIVVAAGFQGRNAAGEITTLGLGGSDTTAVVLAAALDAKRCEICSDVDGVYSADPRLVEHACRIEEISYAEMVEMARHGASVLNPDAVKHAQKHQVAIYCRSTFEPDSPGTLIHDISSSDPRVVGVARHEELVSLAFDESDQATGRILDELQDDDVFVNHADSRTGRRNIFIPAHRLPDTGSFIENLKTRFREKLSIGLEVSSVSAIGHGVGQADHIRESSRRFSEQAGYPSHHDFANEHSITCVVQPDHSIELMNIFHREFECPAEAA